MNDSRVPRLSVVMVTYNSAGVVARALDSLPHDVEVIVVDNASTDDTIQVIELRRPSARIIASKTNDGFARAVNRGVAEAHSSTLLLLNPDAEIDEKSIAKTLAVLDRDPTVGITAPLVVEGDGTLATLAAGFEPTIWRMFTHSSGVARFSHHRSYLRGHYLMRHRRLDRSPHEVEWVSGGCLFVRRTVWDELGGLTERWFMYAEDVEFCLRAGDAGWRILLIMDATASHVVGASSAGSHSIRTIWLENLFDLYQERYRAGFARQIAWRAVVATGYAARWTVSRVTDLMARREPSHDTRRFSAYAHAAARVRPQHSDTRLEPARLGQTRDTHYTQVARFYPVARTAHIERLASMQPGTFFYSSTRRDWDEDLARATPDVERVGLMELLARVWTRGFERLEIPEPYAIALLPHATLIALVVKAQRVIKRRPTELVFYAIENLDQVEKVRSKLPVPTRLIRTAANLALRLVFSETGRAAFGTAGALEAYRAQLGDRGWQRATRGTEIALIPGLSAPDPTADSADRDDDLVCFLGSLEERKGILDVLRAWPLVTAVRPESRLLIIGHGPLDGVVQHFAEQHANVEVLMDPPRTAIRRLLASAHALVLPSRRTPVWREQIGLPILEALSAGCEIVTNTETGIADWLRENNHQVIRTNANSREIAAAVRAALDATRTREEVQRDLPATDGRYAADAWLFRKPTPSPTLGG